MFKKMLFTSVALVPIIFGGCVSQSAARQDSGHKAVTTEKLEPYACGEITKLHTFQGIFLASQPAEADFEQAKKGGVKSVINLRHSAEQKDFNEKAKIEWLGLNYFNPAWNGPDELTDARFAEVQKLLETAERPILLHCASANRVGAHWIVYRVKNGGLSLDAAVAEARTVGLKSPDYEAKARAYLQKTMAR